jgi:AraC family transcriptional regulator
MSVELNHSGAIAGGLGLSSVSTIVTRSLGGAQAVMSLIRCGTDQLGTTSRIPPQDAFALGVYLNDIPEQEIRSRGRLKFRQAYPKNSMTFVDLVDEYSANILHPQDTLTFHIPRPLFDWLLQDVRRPRSDMRFSSGLTDPVIAHLAGSLLPAYRRSDELNMLFVEHVVSALCVHLAKQYGGPLSDAPWPRGGGRLAPWQERRAKELIEANLGSHLSVADLAAACNLSVAHFSRSFQRSTNMPPHRWLIHRRLEKAAALMMKADLSLSEIAQSCGFNDQSHFTRSFRRVYGVSPRMWQRDRGAF